MNIIDLKVKIRNETTLNNKINQLISSKTLRLEN